MKDCFLNYKSRDFIKYISTFLESVSVSCNGIHKKYFNNAPYSKICTDFLLLKVLSNFQVFRKFSFKGLKYIFLKFWIVANANIFQIKERKISFRYNLNSLRTEEKDVWLDQVPVDDGQWHTVKVSYNCEDHLSKYNYTALLFLFIL